MVKVEVEQKESQEQVKTNKKSFTFEPYFSDKDVTVGGIQKLIESIKKRLPKEEDV